MSRFLRHIPAYLPTGVVLCAILYLSLTADPMPNTSRFFDFPGADKLVHFIMYGGLTGCFCFDYYRRPCNSYNAKVPVIATLTAIIISGVVELLQNSMGLGRTGDWLDMLANALGALVGMVVGDALMRRWFAK